MRKNTLVSARAVLSLVKPRQNFTSFRSYATEGSKNRPSVAIFGGNGSLGQHIINHIGQYADVTVGCRHPEQFNKQKHNVVATKCDIRDPNDVEQFIQGKDTIINCVGLLAESDNTFVDIYVEGTKNIAYAARRNGVKNYVQVSAMGAQIDHDSFIADFKYRAEDMAYAAFPDVVIVRPSIMFSDQKNTSALLNKIASTLRFLPVLPLPYNQTVKPVFMDDVARGIAKLSGVVPNSIDARGKTALLEGPNEYTISKAIGLVAGRKIITFPMNQTILSLLTHVNHFVPNPTVTMDLLKMAEGAQLTAEQTKAEIYDPRELRSILEFSDIGVQPQSLESVLGKK